MLTQLQLLSLLERCKPASSLLDFGAWQQDSIASAPTVCPAKMDGNHPKETVDKDNEEVIDVDQNEEAVGNRWNVHIS